MDRATVGPGEMTKGLIASEVLSRNGSHQLVTGAACSALTQLVAAKALMQQLSPGSWPSQSTGRTLTRSAETPCIAPGQPATTRSEYGSCRRRLSGHSRLPLAMPPEVEGAGQSIPDSPDGLAFG